MLNGVVIRLLTIPLGFVTTALATRDLGPVRFGVFAAVLSAMTILLVSDFGTGRAMANRLASEHGRDDIAAMRTTIAAATLTTTAMGIGIGAIAFASTLWVNWAVVLGAPQLSRAEVNAVVYVVALCLAFGLPLSRGTGVLSGMQREATAQRWLLWVALGVFSGIVACFLTHAPLWCFVAASLGVPVAVNAVQFFWVMNRTFPELKPKLSEATWECARDLFKSGPAYAALQLSSLAISADIVIVGHQVGAHGAAILSISTSLFAPVLTSLVIASNQLWPAMSEAVARGDHDWVVSRLRKVVLGTLVVTVASCGAVVLIARPVSRLFFGADFVPPWSVLLFAAPWVVYSVVIFQVGGMLAAMGRASKQAAISMVALLVNVAVVWLTTDIMGAPGAYLGSVITYAVIVGIPSVIMVRSALKELSAKR
ncbi:lipopolysaccharide biosynthesis protein [Smaragdicoccus niigatensis]